MAPGRGEGSYGEDLQGDGEEEEEDDDDDGEERPRGRSPRGIGALVAQKRPLPSVGLVLFGKKTRDLPDLCSCHGCRRRFPNTGRRERLRPLDSQWRVVLLCGGCLGAVRSAQVCSYCFAGFVGRDGGFVSCRGCACRVHVECLPEQRGFLAPSDLDPQLFTCVDCCAIPISRARKDRRSGDSSASGVSDIDLENVVRSKKAVDVNNVVAAVATMAAKNAADLARGALLVLAEKFPRYATVPDEELALNLHRAMNGSQRISRNLSAVNSDCLISDRRGLPKGTLLDKEPETGNYSFCREVELCTEDALFETMEIIDVKPLNVISASEDNFVANLDTGQEKCEVEEHRKADATEMPAREEQASCSDKFVNSTGDRDSVDRESASCPQPGGSNSAAASQQDEKHSMPDRYMKKYFKRPPRTKDR